MKVQSEAFQSAATLDIPRARKVLEHLVAHPKEHNQASYGERVGCATVMCIAGTVIYQDAVAAEQVSWQRMCSISVVEHMCNPWGWSGEDFDTSWIQETAASLLRLSHADVQTLFYEFDNQAALARLESWIQAAEQVQARLNA